MARRLSPWVRKMIGGIAVGVAVGVLAAIAAYVRPLFLERGELWTYDVRARGAADPDSRSPDIAFVEVGEQDIEDVDNNMLLSWPWPRELYGHITNYLVADGARAIIFDWLFQDRGQYSVADAEVFAESMRKAGNVIIGLALTQEPLKRLPSEGSWALRLREFASRADAEKAAVRLSAWNVRSFLIGDRPTVLWYGGKKKAEDVLLVHNRVSAVDELADLFGEPPADGAEPVPRELSAAELAGEFTSADVIAERDGLELPGAGPATFESRDGIDPPLAVIAAAPAHAGNVYQEPDADGILRRYAPLVRHAGRDYPSLAMAAWMVGNPGVELRVDDGDLVAGDRRIPLDDDGRFTLRFRGARVYPRTPAWEILRSQSSVLEARDYDDAAAKAEAEAKADPAKAAELTAAAAEARAEAAKARAKRSLTEGRFRGKYVIVSASGQSLRDIRITPVSKVHEGAEIQANALDNLLAGDTIHRESRLGDALIAWLLALLMAVGITALWSAFRRLWLASLAVAGAVAVFLTGYFWLADWLYAGRGLWVAVAVPSGGALASAFVALLVTVAGERRNRRFVQEALGRYTSSALVNELINHPEHLSLEWGEQREMSVYFSDIAGFTTISEGLAPEKLVALLNDYLTHMTDLVLAHGGVVDKYIGDAVMAFWGAPIPDKEHALHALQCAVAMRKKTDELRAGWIERYGHAVHVRAGVNSGFAVVGNMGSKHKYNYTVMGDMVNLASRLEGANKAYGTELMVSEATATRIAGTFDVRELDLIAVKGKALGVRVFEVFGATGDAPEATRRAVVEFEKGLALYREQKFESAITAFEAALAERPGDPPSEVYIERCKHFLSDPPGEDWDGVWRMKEK